MSRRITYITALINGDPVRVREGLTVLDAARQAGIYIPSICYLENLKSYGGCRLCIVEIKGIKGFPTACTTPLEPGMEVLTKTTELQRLRSEILELILSEHPYTCLVCGDKKECMDFMHTTRKAGTITGCNFCTSNGDCELQDLIDYLDLKDVRYPISYRGIPPEKNNPFYDLDYNLCILCGRCVRICNEERNSNVLAFVQRGNTSIVGTSFNESQAEAGCEFCGACVDVCPTGSIAEKMGKWAGLPDRSTETTCTLCAVGCTMNVNTRGGRIVNVGPKPGGRTNPHQLCVRGKFLPADINHHPSRIATPMIRKNGKWIEVNWEEAIQYTAGKLEQYRGEQFGMICSAQDTLEENYSLQKFSRKVMGSNNIDLHLSYPDKELVKDIHSFNLSSSHTGTRDILKADTLLILGADASVSHPLLENRVRKAFTTGRTVLYANTHSTRTSQFANHEINYAAGEEYYFLYVLLAKLANPDGQFTKQNVAKAGKRSGVTGNELKPFVSALAGSRNLWVIAGDDLLRNASGRDTLRALGNLQFIKDGKANCTITFLGYEGNLYGGALSGAHPDLLPGFDPVTDKKAVRKWNKNWDTELSTGVGLACNEMLGNIKKDGIAALMVAGDIPPQKKLAKLKFLIQMNMFRTDLSEYADVVLPITSFLEHDGHFLTLDGKIKKLRRALAGPGKTKTIPGILSELAAAMSESGFSNSRPGSIWKEIQSFIQIPARDTGNGKHSFQPLTLKSPKETTDYPFRINLQHDHFTYRGNSLTALVPDLQAIVYTNDRIEKAKNG